MQEPLLADGSRARAVLDELEKYLAEDDVPAGEVFRSARPLLCAALGEFAAEIERHISASYSVLDSATPSNFIAIKAGSEYDYEHRRCATEHEHEG